MPDVSSSSSSLSSSSSIDSSSSSLSSSSSSNDLFYRQINGALINQGNYNLLPFTWIGERGTSSDLGDDSKINFEIQASSSPYMDYDAVIERDNSALTETPEVTDPDTYLPQDERAYYEHRRVFYVDVIAKDSGGVKEVRTHVEPNKYEFEEVEDSFLIPKFIWENE